MNRPDDAIVPPHLDDARCADLVLGLLPAREREAALAHASECPACESRLRAHASAGERARADAPGRATVTPLPAPRPRRTAWAALAAAAAAAIAVGVFTWPHPGGPVDAGPWLPDPGQEIRTRSDAATDPHLAAGLSAYRDRDLARACAELRAARTEGPAEALRKLYLGHAMLASGDADGAASVLRGVEWRFVPEPWRRDGFATLARALRASGHAGGADSVERVLARPDAVTPLVP